MLDESFDNIEQVQIADCCKPIPGDQVGVSKF